MGTPAAAAALRIDKEMESPEKDTWIQVFRDASVFVVGVRTKVDADWARIEVFYRVPSSLGPVHSLLLSKETIAPVAGPVGYGASDPFAVELLDTAEFVRVTFLREITRREFRT